MTTLLILPHQLFDISVIYDILKKNIEFEKEKLECVCWEHPHYYTKYNYNKKKLMLHRGSMRYYHEYLKSKNVKVKYYSFREIPKINTYYIFDPIDKIKLPKNATILESPNFILTKDIYEKYRTKTKHFLFNNFYMFGKKEIDVMPSIKSQDTLNRNTIPKDTKIHKVPSNSGDSKYIKEAAVYVNRHFKNNLGNTDGFIFPLSHKTAKKFLVEFITKKLFNFGKYQDAISKGENYLFHSVLSSSLNIGLLEPISIIEDVLKKKNAPINSVEGFIRQLFWREYQRYCYIYYDFTKKNYFGGQKKLSNRWYDGTLGIDPVDDCIKMGIDTGYLHHINRLMVIGNFMNLTGISPKEGHRWFMEFSCDSYEWVMAQNVLDMVFFVSGGVTMRRPYISSSYYIINMSNYKKGNWSDKWDEYYHKFLKDKKQKLWNFRYYFRGLK